MPVKAVMEAVHLKHSVREPPQGNECVSAMQGTLAMGLFVLVGMLCNAIQSVIHLRTYTLH